MENLPDCSTYVVFLLEIKRNRTIQTGIRINNKAFSRNMEQFLISKRKFNLKRL